MQMTSGFIPGVDDDEEPAEALSASSAHIDGTFGTHVLNPDALQAASAISRDHHSITAAELYEEAETARATLVWLARQGDPNAFAELVLRNEETGESVSQGKLHEQWHQLANECDRLLVWSHVEAGKTQQLPILRTLYELGRNPNLRVAIVSNTHEQAVKIVRTIAKYIENSAELRSVFPNLEPDRSQRWTTNVLTVKRAGFPKDPSVQAFGVHGAVTGARIDLLILDDILDHENTRSATARQDLWEWYNSTLVGRLSTNGRIIIVGNAWHPDDLLHRLARMARWKAVRCSVLDAAGQPTWPERWPLTRIEKARTEMPPTEFARQLLSQARSDEDARFKREWVDAALDRGRGLGMTDAIEYLPPGYRVHIGVDLGASRSKRAGRTAISTVLSQPDGSRELLGIVSGKWTGREIMSRVIQTHGQFGGGIVVVENNAAQDYLAQFLADVGIPVLPFTTGSNKLSREFGVESIATELAMGKWIFPTNADGTLDPEIEAFVSELLYYSPEAHTGDRLMATWLAREGARLLAPTEPGVVRASIIRV